MLLLCLQTDEGRNESMRYGDNLKGMPFAELNPMIGSEELGSGENYAAPINTSHTAYSL